MGRVRKQIRNNKRHILIFMTVLIVVSALARPMTVCAASYKSWVDNASSSSLYGGSSFYTGETDPDSAKVEEDAGWLEEHLSRAIISFAYVMWELEREAGMTIDGVILGRLANGISVNNFGFDLSDGNIYGVLSTIVYAILRNFVFGIFGIYYFAMLINFLIKGTGRGRASLKDALYNFVFVFALLYAVPIATDYAIFFRDSLLKGFMEKALSFQSGATALNLPGLFITEAESNFKVTYAILALFATAGGIWLGFNYIKIAIQEAYLFGIFPAVAFRSFSDKQILNKWTGQFITNLFVPLIDAIGFTMLSYMVSQPDALASFGKKMVALLLFFSIIPCRNAVLQLFGAPVPGGRGLSLAPLAMMASRMMHGGGRGGNSNSGLSGGEGKNKPAGSGGEGNSGDNARITDPNKQAQSNTSNGTESGNISSSQSSSGDIGGQNSDINAGGGENQTSEMGANEQTSDLGETDDLYENGESSDASLDESIEGESEINSEVTEDGSVSQEINSEGDTLSSADELNLAEAGAAESIQEEESASNNQENSAQNEAAANAEASAATEAKEEAEIKAQEASAALEKPVADENTENASEQTAGRTTASGSSGNASEQTIQNNRKELEEAKKTSDGIGEKFNSTADTKNEFGTDNSAELIRQSKQYYAMAEQAGNAQHQYGARADQAAAKARAHHDKSLESADYSQKRANIFNSNGAKHVASALDTSGRIVASGAGIAAAAAAVSATAISGDTNTVVGAGMLAKMGTENTVEKLATNNEKLRSGIGNAFQQEADFKKKFATKSPAVTHNIKKAAANTQNMKEASERRGRYIHESVMAQRAAEQMETKIQEHPDVQYRAPDTNKEAAKEINNSMDDIKKASKK